MISGSPEIAVPQGPAQPPTTGDHAARGNSLWRFLRFRVLAGLATLLVVSVLVFAGTEVLPGDPASAVLGRNATPGELAELRQTMGLSDPAYQRYADWVAGAAVGDLGNTAAGYAAGKETPVWHEISDKLRNSLVLAAITTLVLVPLSLLLGVMAAVAAGRAADHAISIVSLAVISLPEFIIGSLLIVIFFSYFGLLPPTALVAPGASPLDRPEALVLPVATLLGASIASCIRMVRAGMIETLRSDYVQTARLNGFRERKVIVRYALRNALGPSVQIFAQNIQYLIGGIIVVEYLFSYPGLGEELVNAVAIRDVREVQSIALLVAAFYIALNILADLLVVLLVPKLRTR